MSASEYEIVERITPSVLVSSATGWTPEGITQGTPDLETDSLDETAKLLNEITSLIRRFVVMQDEQAVAAALWVLHTHVFDAADQTPYLSITSAEKRSGKTRLLEVLRLLVWKPWFTGHATAAVIARKIDTIHPTLLFDESDATFKGNPEFVQTFRGVLDTGFERGGAYSCCVGKSHEPRDFETFCPKAIAGIGSLPGTVADRAIPLRLQRKGKIDKAARLRRRKVELEVAPLRSRIETWAAMALEALREAEPELPDQLTDRAQDVVEPLLAIADLAGGGWPEKARRAFVTLYSAEALEDDSLGVQLLQDCRDVFDQYEEDRLSSADLCSALGALEERPWGELNRGKSMTVRGLARLLDPYGIKSRTIRLDDERTPKGYYRSSFEKVWTIYLSPPVLESATPPQVNDDGPFPPLPETPRPDSVAEETQGKTQAGVDCVAVADKPFSNEGEEQAERACDYFCGVDTGALCKRCGWPFEDHWLT